MVSIVNSGLKLMVLVSVLMIRVNMVFVSQVVILVRLLVVVILLWLKILEERVISVLDSVW